MLIEVVHINGKYAPDTGEHLPPIGLKDSYYADLADRLYVANSLGSTVIYWPNLMGLDKGILDNPDETARALDADPFLPLVSDMDRFVVMPDGKKPIEKIIKDLALEDALLQKYGQAIILGAYLGVCVPFVADNLMSRNPGSVVNIDMSLSIDAGFRNIRPEFGLIKHSSLSAE